MPSCARAAGVHRTLKTSRRSRQCRRVCFSNRSVTRRRKPTSCRCGISSAASSMPSFLPSLGENSAAAMRTCALSLSTKVNRDRSRRSWKERPPEISIRDLRQLGEDAQRAAVARYVEADLEKHFDIQAGPLIRVVIFRLGDFLTQVVWSYPHIILDGWSLGILHRDLLQIYRSLSISTGLALPEPAPYRDYVRWLATRDAVASRTFWSDYLAAYPKLAAQAGPSTMRRLADLPGGTYFGI